MLNEMITSNAQFELSDSELDIIAGGVTTEKQIGLFANAHNELASEFSVGPNGFSSKTQTLEDKTLTFGLKDVSVGG